MMQVNVDTLRGVATELSINEKFIVSAKVILTGFLVVFTMLFLLILIIKLYSAIVFAVQRKLDARAKRRERVMERVSRESGVHIVTKPAYVTPPETDNDIPEEIAAVIAAAVAATMLPGQPVKIKSIKKAGDGRSAWANAGVLDNTRPF